MSDFRSLSAEVSASPQIDTSDVATAQERGFAMIVNNRPDGEVEGQPTGAEIERAAEEAGLAYRHIPISHGNFGPAEVAAMEQALADAGGPVLAYCRTGTRSTLLWSLVQARQGRPLADIVDEAAAAGYDISPVMSAMQAYSSSKPG